MGPPKQGGLVEVAGFCAGGGRGAAGLVVVAAAPGTAGLVVVAAAPGTAGLGAPGTAGLGPSDARTPP